MNRETFKITREKLNHTQKSLGEYLGLSMRQVRRYESGASDVPGPLAILLKILISRRIPKIENPGK